jgi:hypothetical protein
MSVDSVLTYADLSKNVIIHMYQWFDETSGVSHMIDYHKVNVYYESIKRELNKRLKFDSRCDARLKAEVEGCTRLTYTMCREEP